jgi:hypothetical protein
MGVPALGDEDQGRITTAPGHQQNSGMMKDAPLEDVSKRIRAFGPTSNQRSPCNADGLFHLQSRNQSLLIDLVDLINP